MPNDAATLGDRPAFPHHRRSRKPDRAATAFAGGADPRLPRPHRRDRSAAQRLSAGHRGAGAGSGARRGSRDHGRQLSRPDARHPVRAEGHLLHRRHPHDEPLAYARRLRPGLRRHHRRQAASGRCNPARQAGNTRVRARWSIVRPALATGTQSVEPRACHWRIVQRIGCRRRGGADDGRPRLRYRRFDPQPSRALWPGRLEADLWPGQPLRRLYQLVQLRSRRPDDVVRRGLRDHAAGDRRP